MQGRTKLLLFSAVFACGCRALPQSGDWCPLDIAAGVPADLRGLSAIDAETCWASGAGGAVLRTVDGISWERILIPGADGLDFRDVQAFSAEEALVVSAGTPARIYRTETGGSTWDLVYDNPDERVFFDAMAFWDDRRGLVFSDPIDGRLLVIATADGGRSWRALPRDAFPPSPDGEAGFAASGTCLAVSGENDAWIGLGGTAGARVFRTRDGGASWDVVDTPICAGESSRGIFSLVVLDRGRGIAVGGDYSQPELMEANAAWTADDGSTWQIVSAAQPTGYRSSVASVQGRRGALIAVGTNGSDLSLDGGRSWRRISNQGYHVVAGGKDGSMWAAGSDGRIAKLVWSE